MELESIVSLGANEKLAHAWRKKDSCSERFQSHLVGETNCFQGRGQSYWETGCLQEGQN